MRHLIAVGVLLVLAACDEQPQQEKPEIRAEMIVHLAKNAFNIACNTRDGLVEYVRHAGTDETTKANAMITSGDCAIMPATETFKVLSVNADVSHLMREVEFVNVKSNMTDGMWTLDEAFQESHSPSPS